jgi:hypothetical protein
MLDSLGATILLEGTKFFRIMGEIKIEGKKEEVTFDSYYGWLSEDERFNLRQTDPRYAP